MKLHNEELHNLYSSPDIFGIMKSRETTMGRACVMHAKIEKCTQILAGEPERNRP
jgi:hypothetical protein